jgi:hypothetical protein
MKFRKKPVVIEAISVRLIIRAMSQSYNDLPDWAKTAYEQGIICAVQREGFTIKTLEGNMIAQGDDMVIRGVKGEIYPCKSDIFEATYEKVD